MRLMSKTTKPRSKTPSRIAWRKANKEKLRAYQAEYRDKNREEYNRKIREYCRQNRDRINHNQRLSRIKRLYGLSQEQYEKMLRRQNDGCGICGKPMKKYRLSIDHEHQTGKVRGLLCSPCNRALGILGDTEEGLLKALEYIKLYKRRKDGRLRTT